jgi:hypothetical protein
MGMPWEILDPHSRECRSQLISMERPRTAALFPDTPSVHGRAHTLSMVSDACNPR